MGRPTDEGADPEGPSGVGGLVIGDRSVPGRTALPFPQLNLSGQGALSLPPDLGILRRANPRGSEHAACRAQWHGEAIPLPNRWHRTVWCGLGAWLRVGAGGARTRPGNLLGKLVQAPRTSVGWAPVTGWGGQSRRPRPSIALSPGTRRRRLFWTRRLVFVVTETESLTISNCFCHRRNRRCRQRGALLAPLGSGERNMLLSGRADSRRDSRGQGHRLLRLSGGLLDTLRGRCRHGGGPRGNVRIGQGAIVGANALVNRSVAPGVSVGGVPARPLHHKSDSTWAPNPEVCPKNPPGAHHVECRRASD